MKSLLRKLILLTIFTLATATCVYSQMKDGLYLVIRIDKAEYQAKELTGNENALQFSRMFEEYNTDEYARIIVDTTQYVQLELESEPKTEQQTRAGRYYC